MAMMANDNLSVKINKDRTGKRLSSFRSRPTVPDSGTGGVSWASAQLLPVAVETGQPIRACGLTG